ncbi:8673_t:CDS:2, partial [Dentiscutata erythropus]
YWERSYQTWTVKGWDEFYFEIFPSNTNQQSCDALKKELVVLMKKHKRNTNKHKKAVSLLNNITVSTFMVRSSDPNKIIDIKNSLNILSGFCGAHVLINHPTSHYCLHGRKERPDILELPRRKLETHTEEYCKILLERQESQIKEVSQSGQHLFKLLKWSIIDSKLFGIAVQISSCSRPAVNLHQVDKVAVPLLNLIIDERRIGSVSSLYESIKISIGLQKDYVIDSYTVLSAAFSVCSYFPIPSLGLEIQFKPVWEYHQLVPGNGGSGSSFCYFVVAIKNEKKQLFPFFIVEFKKHDREIHKDHAVVTAEVSFKLNCLLLITSEQK